MTEDIGLWGVPLAMLGGAIRVSTPFLFVSLGECLTERSGRINLGLEGTLVFGAMTGYAISYLAGDAFAGVIAAAFAGALFGVVHGWVCKFKGVNDIAMGIAMMLLGLGLAFFFGGISSGQGLMAVALVIFARWNPINCLWASLLFGGAGALGPALQSVGITQGYYLFYAAPYVLTLGLLIATSSPDRALQGAPRELSITK